MAYPRGTPLKFLVLSLALLCAGCATNFGIQSPEARGRVVDKLTDRGIPGAVVCLRGHPDACTVSDAKGGYELKATYTAGHMLSMDFKDNANEGLIVSAEGYETRSVDSLYSLSIELTPFRPNSRQPQ